MGIHPADTSPAARAGLFANIPRVKAQDLLHRGQFDPTDYRGIYALYLRAFGDQKLAERERSRALERYVDERTKRQ